MAITNINEYVPVIVNQEFDWFPKDVVTADELNKIFDSFKTQGNYTAEALTTVIEKINFNYSELRRDVDALTAGAVPDGTVTTEKLADEAVTYAKLNEDVTQKFDTLNSTTENLQKTHATDLINLQNAITSVYNYIKAYHKIPDEVSKKYVWGTSARDMGHCSIVEAPLDDTYSIPADGVYNILVISAGGVAIKKRIDRESNIYFDTKKDADHFLHYNVAAGRAEEPSYGYPPQASVRAANGQTYSFAQIPSGGNGAIAVGNLTLKANDFIRITRSRLYNINYENYTPDKITISVNDRVVGVFVDAAGTVGGYAEQCDSTLFNTYKHGTEGVSCTFPKDGDTLPDNVYAENAVYDFEKYIPKVPALELGSEINTPQHKLNHTLEACQLINLSGTFVLLGGVGAGFGDLTDVIQLYNHAGWEGWRMGTDYVYLAPAYNHMPIKTTVPSIGLGSPALFLGEKYTRGFNWWSGAQINIDDYSPHAAVFINKID